jgi:hypothetical protein
MTKKPTKTSEYKDIFGAFLKEYTNQLENNKELLPFNFNILDAQCGTIKENSHTNILMKLLEYKYKYGGYVFLKDFIELAGFNIQIDDSEPVAFETEFFDAVPIIENDDSIKKNKTKQGRIDGLIYQKEKFAIIIENKINGAPPQPNQLERYIKSVLGSGTKDSIVNSSDQVFVVLLTKDGVEPPDDESIVYMRERGILNDPEPNDSSKLISGPRYFACSYRYHVLHWLENSVQPLVYQKELVLNTGIIQYIDFLKGMLGQREGQTLLREHCKNKFETIINDYILNYIQKYKKDKLKKQNEYLHKLYIYLQKELSNYQKKSDNDSKIRVDCINLLQSLVYEKAEEPMLDFMKATKEFFTSGDSNNPPLIEEKDYIVNHHFTFYYINIRDKNWPVGVKIGWYPAHFFYEQPTASLFYEDPSKVGTEEENDGNGFKYNITGKAWRREYPTDHPCINVESFEGEKLKKLYEDSGIRGIIESLNQSIKLKNKAY